MLICSRKFIKSTLILDMLDRAISSPQLAFTQEFSQEMQWIINNDYLHEQLYRVLIDEVHAISSDHISKQLEDQLLEAIQNFTQKISLKMKEIVHNCTLEINEHKHKIKEYQLQLHVKGENIQNLNENIEAFKTKIKNWQSEYQALKSQMTEMQEKYERRLREVKREKKQIKQTFRMVQQSTEFQRALLENLQIEKEQIHQQILQQQREKQVLKSQLEEIKQKCIESAKKIEASASKLTWQEKRIEKLELIVTEKDALIVKLRQQILDFHQQQQELNSQQDNKSQSMAAAKIFLQDKRRDESPKKGVSFIQSFKLSDQMMNINEDYEQISRNSYLSIRKSCSDRLEVNKSLSQLEENEEEHDIPQTYTEVTQAKNHQNVNLSRIHVPDFYLAHFLLTSQAIKIKLNSEIYLGIDLSSLYPEIVRSGIPFHMWDEWIRQKLQELAKL